MIPRVKLAPEPNFLVDVSIKLVGHLGLLKARILSKINAWVQIRTCKLKDVKFTEYNLQTFSQIEELNCLRQWFVTALVRMLLLPNV